MRVQDGTSLLRARLVSAQRMSPGLVINSESQLETAGFGTFSTLPTEQFGRARRNTVPRTAYCRTALRNGSVKHIAPRVGAILAKEMYASVALGESDAWNET